VDFNIGANRGGFFPHCAIFNYFRPFSIKEFCFQLLCGTHQFFFLICPPFFSHSLTGFCFGGIFFPEGVHIPQGFIFRRPLSVIGAFFGGFQPVALFTPPFITLFWRPLFKPPCFLFTTPFVRP